MDHVINRVGAFGRFQRCMLLNFGLVFAFLCTNLYFTIFTTAEPTLLCSSSSVTSIENETCKIWSNNTGECTFDTKYYGKTIASEWGLVCDRKYLASLTQSIYLFGNMCSLFLGFLSDLYGRRRSTIAFLSLFPLVLITGGILQLNFIPLSWYTRYMVYCCMMFLSSMLETAIYGVVLVLTMEITTPAYHSIFATITFYSYTSGQFFVLAIAYLLRDWRIYSWITAVFSLLVLILQVLFMPESPRWQITKNLNKEADESLQKIALINKNKYDKREIDDLFDGKESSEDVQVEFKQIVMPCRNAVKTILLIYTFIAITLTFYGISLGVTSIEALDPYAAYVASSLSELIGYTVCLINRKIGRKNANIMFLSLSSISCLLVGIVPYLIKVPHSDSSVSLYSLIMLVLVSMSKCAATGAYGNVLVYATELYPTSVRTTAVLLVHGMSGIGSLIAPLVNLSGAMLWKPMPYFIFSSASFLAAIFSLILPETYHE